MISGALIELANPALIPPAGPFRLPLPDFDQIFLSVPSIDETCFNRASPKLRNPNGQAVGAHALVEGDLAANYFRRMRGRQVYVDTGKNPALAGTDFCIWRAVDAYVAGDLSKTPLPYGTSSAFDGGRSLLGSGENGIRQSVHYRNSSGVIYPEEFTISTGVTPRANWRLTVGRFDEGFTHLVDKTSGVGDAIAKKAVAAGATRALPSYPTMLGGGPTAGAYGGVDVAFFGSVRRWVADADVNGVTNALRDYFGVRAVNI